MFLDDDDWSDDDAWSGEDDEFGEADDDDEADVGRAPICPSCGVTALPSQLSNVIDSEFACDNEGCDAYGETL
jgi:hypothetical protein